MEDMDKEPTVSKWVLIKWKNQNAPKIFSPICVPNSKSLGFLKKNLWVSVVRVVGNLLDFIFSDPTFFKFHESQQNKLEVLKTKIDNFTPEKKVDYLAAIWIF